LRLLGLPCARAPQLSLLWVTLSRVNHAGLAPLAEPVGAMWAGANENSEPFAQFVPPHLRNRHAQTSRQERQKKAARDVSQDGPHTTYTAAAAAAAEPTPLPTAARTKTSGSRAPRSTRFHKLHNCPKPGRR